MSETVKKIDVRSIVTKIIIVIAALGGYHLTMSPEGEILMPVGFVKQEDGSFAFAGFTDKAIVVNEKQKGETIYVQVKDENGEPIFDEATGQPKLKAEEQIITVPRVIELDSVAWVSPREVIQKLREEMVMSNMRLENEMQFSRAIATELNKVIEWKDKKFPGERR